MLNAASSASVMWEVRGKSGMPATCRLHQLDVDRFSIDITIGTNEVMRETFGLEPDAIRHADFLRRDFVRSGWTETFHRDE